MNPTFLIDYLVVFSYFLFVSTLENSISHFTDEPQGLLICFPGSGGGRAETYIATKKVMLIV